MSEKKSPLKDKPLRQAGQSGDESLRSLVFEHLLSYYFVAAILWTMAMYEWVQHWRHAPPAPIPITFFAVGMSIYVWFKIRKIQKTAERYKLGRDGEKVVAELLDRYRVKGYRVYHDIPGDGWNIDHVIISTRGVFAIETKTRSKPVAGEPVVVFNGISVAVDGGPEDEKPIRQSLAQTKQLRTMLKEWTGYDFSIQGVVVYPGWYVQRNSASKSADVWVLNPKALHKWIEKQDEVIPVERVKQAATALAKYIRSSDA